jgi:hypothetical protein
MGKPWNIRGLVSDVAESHRTLNCLLVAQHEISIKYKK